MNPAQDTLYRVHQMQAEQLGEAALPYQEFCARSCKNHETEASGLVFPACSVKVAVQVQLQTRFNLGRLCFTENAVTAVPADELLKAVQRHAAGDWGTLDQTDWEGSDKALRDGGRVFSRYESSAGRKFWIVTEADRAVTTVSLPEDK